MKRIAIVGAGLSGRLLALNLLRRASPDWPVHIRILDRGGESYLGPAYSDDADYLLLNVPAGRMGAFSDDPEHFLTWARERGGSPSELDFLPRRLYREYVFALMDAAMRGRAPGTTLEYVRGEVTDVATDGAFATVHVEGRPPVVADAGRPGPRQLRAPCTPDREPCRTR